MENLLPARNLVTVYETEWIGKVIDRLTGKVKYRTFPCLTWEEAQKRAEKQAKYLGCGDRFEIRVLMKL